MKFDETWTELAYNNRDPVYLQVVRHFKERIAAGKLEAGQAIPSRRELGSLLRINPNTAQRAYKEMEEQKLITTEGNSPSRITTNADILRSIRSELLESAIDVFLTSVKSIEISADELSELVKRKFEQRQDKRGPEKEGSA
ncbi:GntR family transcriptional regulator [Paenibacillus methanolicus]|uniref:DNA-binding transcriptional regulator YhcF (GntR family) n=1 Tax=Paenibacillus methanolicus TaxID=582686 RepID=A0A5S5BZ54_9BACL|nr:GntR family transcriptional regulator [Paenibacillus methanolicus]TYP72461.1 DNA-binding transcriptional regulator YhcF (GntR family) [Paenibacillus methanolicus]